jgi:hypothetical protein
MNPENLIPVSEQSIKDYVLAKEENKLNAVFLHRWIEHKKKYFSNFLSYAFDKEGNLYRRNFLGDNVWVLTPEFVQSDLSQ